MPYLSEFYTAKQLLEETFKWKLDKIIPFNKARVLLYGKDAESLGYWILATYLKEFQKGILIGLGDYHDGHLFDLNILAEHILAVGEDPSTLFDKLKVGAAYNLEQFKRLIEELKEVDPSLILLLNPDRLAKRVYLFQILNNLIWDLTNNWRGPIVFTSDLNQLSKSYPPKPNLPNYIRHIADVVIFVKKRMGSVFYLYLIKHPSEPYTKLVFSMGEIYGEKLTFY